jgi:hypothetical protein
VYSSHPSVPVADENAATIDAFLARIANGVQIACESRVREYLSLFADTADVVLHAVEAARRFFPDAQLVVDVYQDPEINDEYLVLYIRMPHYDDSVMERIAAAEAEYLDRLADKSGWIQLTTDFRTPNE